jgi:hypothetical protein
MVALCGANVFAEPVTAAESRSFVGYAYDLKSGDLVYVERHQEILRSEGRAELETRYFDDSGQPIAVRTAEFAVNPLVPEFRLEDLRTGYEEGMRRADDELIVYRERPENDRRKQREVEAAENLVADAGFDRMVGTAWERLLTGQVVEAEFLVPSRLRSVGIEFFKCDEGEIDGEPTVTFRMRFDNALLRLLAGSVDVTYHREQRFLMRYEGLSNIADETGDNHRVRIEFPLEERSDWLTAEGALPRRVANDG